MDTRAINIFGSWGLTKGRLGKVFLTFLLSGAIYAVIYVVLLGLAAGAAMGMTGKGFAEVMQPDVSTVAAVFSPAMIVRNVINGLIAVAGLVFLVCPGAALYQQIAGRQAEDAFE
jgi:hypothetical protein